MSASPLTASATAMTSMISAASPGSPRTDASGDGVNIPPIASATPAATAKMTARAHFGFVRLRRMSRMLRTIAAAAASSTTPMTARKPIVLPNSNALDGRFMWSSKCAPPCNYRCVRSAAALRIVVR